VSIFGFLTNYQFSALCELGGRVSTLCGCLTSEIWEFV